MKKLLTVLMAMGFVMALTLPALADVSVSAEIEKTKDKEVTEKVSIEKAHYVGVKQIATPTHSAEAQAVKNDVNTGNSVTEAPNPAIAPTYTLDPITEQVILVDPGKPATPINKQAVINTGAGDATSGVTGINQSPGSLNNQGNAVSVSMAAAGNAFLHAESSAEKINGDMLEDREGNSMTSDKSLRSNTIDGALMGVTGILGVNQSAGSMNNQNNATSMAVGLGSMAALSEADLGMVNSGNISSEIAVALADTLSTGALSGGAGITSVNQSSGCMNNQANIIAVCATTPF